jgi:hypothetical protein
MPLRFTIRDLLWITALAGVLMGWWLDRSKLALHDEQASQQAKKYESLLSVQEALDGLVVLHRKLESSPNSNEFELKKCERDMEACKNGIEFLTHK